jgi:hypothetical protein
MDFYDIPPERGAAAQSGTEADGKPWLGVFFDCCRVYSRAHRNAAGSHYIGHCPRCAARVQFKIGEGGSGARFWTAR